MPVVLTLVAVGADVGAGVGFREGQCVGADVRAVGKRVGARVGAVGAGWESTPYTVRKEQAVCDRTDVCKLWRIVFNARGWITLSGFNARGTCTMKGPRL